MAKIQITPELLRAQAKALRDKNGEHIKLYSRIKSQLDGIEHSDWQGSSQAAFLNSFRQRDAELRKFAEDVEMFAQMMDTAADEHDKSETYRTQLMRKGIGTAGAAAGGVGAVAAAGAHWIPTPPLPSPAVPPSGTPVSGVVPITTKYYEMNTGAVGKWFEIGNPYNAAKNRRSMNCVQYARARAMETNGKDSFVGYTTSKNVDDIRANSVVQFDGGDFKHHEVYVESVSRDANGQLMVTFSDSNMGDKQPDGTITTMPFSQFKNYTGASISSYLYF